MLRFRKSIVVLRKIFTFFFPLLFLLLALNNAQAKPLANGLKEKKLFLSLSHQFDILAADSQRQHPHFEIHVKYTEQNEAARRTYRRNFEHDFSLCFFSTQSDLPFWLFEKIADHPKHGILPSSLRKSSYYDFMFRLSLF